MGKPIRTSNLIGIIMVDRGRDSRRSKGIAFITVYGGVGVKDLNAEHTDARTSWVALDRQYHEEDYVFSLLKKNVRVLYLYQIRYQQRPQGRKEG